MEFCGRIMGRARRIGDYPAAGGISFLYMADLIKEVVGVPVVMARRAAYEYHALPGYFIRVVYDCIERSLCYKDVVSRRRVIVFRYQAQVKP